MDAIESRFFVSLVAAIVSLVLGAYLGVITGLTRYSKVFPLIGLFNAIGFIIALILTVTARIGVAKIELRYIDGLIIGIVPATWFGSSLLFWIIDRRVKWLIASIAFGFLLLFLIMAVIYGWGSFKKT